jgi:hypothetical protein
MCRGGEMKIDTKITIIGLIIIIITLSTALYVSGSRRELCEESLREKNRLQNEYFFNYSFTSISPKFTNYSEEAYTKVMLGNMSKFIYFECVNSTLVIKNNKIICEEQGK